MEHTAIINEIPEENLKCHIPTGAVNGNGDVCIIWSNEKSGIRISIAKNDFWKANPGDRSDGGIKVAAFLDIPCIDKSRYHIEQRMDDGEIYGEFANATIKSFVCAEANIILLEITASKKVVPSLLPSEGCDSVTSGGNSDGIEYITRSFAGENLVFPSGIAVAIKLLSEETAHGKTTVHYAIAAATNHDSGDDYIKASVCLAKEADFNVLYAAHKVWWQNFTSESSVILDDKDVELNWYASGYILACCCRNRRFPPGLYGNFVACDDVGWHGDYHLNYNYQTPFFSLFSSNHVALSNCYASPLEDFTSEAERNAREYLGCRGVYFPVGIGPMGLNTSKMAASREHGELFLGQKSDAAYAAAVLIMRWRATYDYDYARDHIYPFVKNVADFWEDYLKEENGRYVIYNDAVHEVPYYREDSFVSGSRDDYSDDFNNLLSLGLVRLLFSGIIDMSECLEADAGRREKWHRILNNLSEFPTYNHLSKRVFRLTERGMKQNDTNSLCIQHIYPAGQVGLSSPAKLFETARNTYYLHDRSLDDNGSCTYIPCGARLGASHEFLIEALKKNYNKYQLPNMLFCHAGGCLEHSNTTLATVNEMLLQSFEGIVRIFPVWSKQHDASFCNLRADGAFLVSAAVRGGKVGSITIVSEKGNQLKLQNPYGCEMRITTSHGTKIFCGDIAVLDTSASEKITVERNYLQ